MADLIYQLCPQMSPREYALLSAAVRAAQEWLLFTFFTLGVVTFVRLLIITRR